MKYLLVSLILWLAALLPLAAPAQQKITPDTVGIGTTNPIEKLHVQNGRIYLNSGVVKNGVGYNYFYWSGHNLVMGTRPGVYAHNSLALMPGGSSSGPLISALRMYDAPKQDSQVLKIQLHSNGNSFINSGNVGIGTATPTTKLDVGGTVQSSGGFISYSEVSQNGFLLANPSKTLRWIIRGLNPETGTGNGGYDLEFVRRSDAGAHIGTALYIRRSDGNVGIGTAAPGSNKLAVEGTVGARKVKVTQNTWADFVLRPDYQLPPLQVVAQFIRQHQHLPDIPSEAEVKENGLDLGEMNRQLLQKVEELTLYLIDQQQQITELKQQIKLIQDKSSDHEK